MRSSSLQRHKAISFLKKLFPSSTVQRGLCSLACASRKKYREWDGRSLKAIGKAHQKMMRGQFGFEILQLYAFRTVFFVSDTNEIIGILRVVI